MLTTELKEEALTALDKLAQNFKMQSIITIRCFSMLRIR